ncbi:reverse transcriptase domain-containing protein [Tanacetum coccineum]|uniref:Reverse transcriptase domain-containing protein n=1 Tax=Tanacetum coccineum TaxID=301880 RepID=A0ABQ5BDS6_9ASTR
MFAATTPENTPMAYRASTSANPNPVISPAFVEANYEALESLLRDRRRQMHNNDLRTKLEYFSEDYDKEQEMEPRPEPTRATTPPLRVASPKIRRRGKRTVGFEGAQSRGESRVERNTEGGRPSEEAPRGNGGQSVNLPPLLTAHLGRGENGQPLQSSLTSAYGGQAPPNNIGGNLPSNGTFLSHHAQPFIPASLSIPNGFMPTHIHPYQQPTSFVNGQHLSFPTQTPLENLPMGGIPAHLPQEGHAPQTFANSNTPSQNGFTYPVNMPTYSYPFYTQPMYTFPNVPVYTNPNLTGAVLNPIGSVTPFVHWIVDYPLPDRLKMPSHIAWHMFTYNLKDSARIWWNSQKAGSILDYEDLKAKFRSHFSQQKKFTKTHLVVHRIKQREGESTRAFITRYTDDTLQILGLHEEQRISVFVHGLRIRSFVEHLSTNLPSTYKGLMEKTYTWVEVREKNKDRFSPYRGPNHGLLPSLSKSSKKVLAMEKAARSFESPPKMFGSKRSQDMSKYCHFHEDYVHDTNDCRHLRTQIQEAVNSGQLSHLMKGIKKERTNSSNTSRGKSKKDKGTAPAEAPILMVSREAHIAKSLAQENTNYEGKEIIFPPVPKVNNAPVIIDAKIFGRKVGRVYMDSGSSCEIIYEHCFEKLNPTIKATKVDLKTPLVGFSGERSWSIDETDEGTKRARKILATNEEGVLSCVNAEEKIIVNDKYPDQTVTIGKQLPKHFKKELQNLLKSNADVFAWTRTNMIGIPRTIMVEGKPFNTEHKLNEYSHVKPIKRNKRGLGPDRNMAACKETEELTKEGILWKVKHQTWVSNPVMVKKSDGGWRICVDFTNINKACPKDCYPLPEINWKIESLSGFRLKCFLDAYKGYHQIQMAEEDEDKTAFYAGEGVFCYKKMSFGLKNAGATYQRLVDKVFSHQIGRNLEAYVDDMVIKSTSEKEMLKDIQETFERFRSINMKLNPKKCSFGVEEGPFLGHLITKQGIKPNPSKVKAVTDLDQPRTLKDIQSLNGKLAALSRFLSKGVERSLAFFKVLKGCKDKKNIQWTTEADKALEKIKKLVQALPTLTAPRVGETLTMHLTASKESISDVLAAKRNEGWTPIYFVSMVLQGAELNYSALEKLVLALVHAARRLRRYFQAHMITVLTNTPIKQMITGPEKTGRVAKWAIELGEHDIVFLRRNEKEMPADFLVEIPFEDNEKNIKTKGGVRFKQ